jgi:hypothetical protein
VIPSAIDPDTNLKLRRRFRFNLKDTASRSRIALDHYEIVAPYFGLIRASKIKNRCVCASRMKDYSSKHKSKFTKSSAKIFK